MFKAASRTTITVMPFSLFELAGQPGGGVLAGTSTAAGVVPDDTMAGFPAINAFAGGALGYLSNITMSNTVACDMMLFDMLWKGGAYAFNANVTLAAQPSYSGRVPGGTDFSNTEIWVECVTAFTGTMSVAVTYTNQAGVTAHTTGTFASGATPTVGRMIRLPLQAGDTGVQKIESVVGSVATAGTFNVLVLRRLAKGRIYAAGGLESLDFPQLGMPQVFDSSALVMVVAADSTSSGIPEMTFTIASK
jgi:hypothetical protein